MRSAARASAPLAALCAALLAGAVAAGPAPRIAILIDDLGNDRAAGDRALALPAEVGVAVLPQTPYARAHALAAVAAGRDLLLHLPLESIEAEPLGPGGIAAGATAAEVRAALVDGLASVPGAAGVNNHMGSLLTQAPESMRVLLSALRERELYFVDSYTTERSVALHTAQELGVPATRRDVFLDPAPADGKAPEQVIAEQWSLMLALARQRGVVLAIGHPNPVTLGWLEREIPKLHEQGFALVPVHEVVGSETLGGNRWHASSSPSPTAAKSSKPSP